MIDLLKEGARFGIVGLIATALHVAVAWTLNHVAGAGPYAANAMAWMIAFVFAYLGHFYWTFGRSGNHRRHQLRFTVVSAAGFGMNNVVIWLVVDQLGLSFDVALVAILVVVPPASWVLSRLWAFRAPEAR